MRRLLEYAITLAVFSLAANAQSAYPVLEQKAEVVSKLPFIYSCPQDGSICMMERNKSGRKMDNRETVDAYYWATITTVDLLCPISQSKLTDTVLNRLHYQTVTNGTVLYWVGGMNCDINITDANLTDFVKIVYLEDEPDNELCTHLILNQTSLIEKLVSDQEMYNISKYLNDTESCYSYVPEIAASLGSCEVCASKNETCPSSNDSFSHADLIVLLIAVAPLQLITIFCVFFSTGWRDHRTCLWNGCCCRRTRRIDDCPQLQTQQQEEIRN